jgi:hypothetical protein
MRDYAEVAASLPVFCVSSTAYQTLSGRFRGDGDVPGFDNKDITEIPKLQQHAILMTEKARANAAKKFLNAFVERLNSLSIWARDMNTQVLLSDGEKKVEMAYLQGVTDQLLKVKSVLLSQRNLLICLHRVWSVLRTRQSRTANEVSRSISLVYSNLPLRRRESKRLRLLPTGAKRQEKVGCTGQHTRPPVAASK